jgi:hypothetical protein
MPACGQARAKGGRAAERPGLTHALRGTPPPTWEWNISEEMPGESKVDAIDTNDDLNRLAPAISSSQAKDLG